MILLICGDRNWTDRAMIHAKLNAFKSFNGAEHTVYHGACRGADLIARDEALALGFTVVAFPADWTKHGRAAGPLRNRQMLDGRPDLIWAFHDNLTASKGTRDMVTEARRRGFKVVHFIHEIEGPVWPSSPTESEK